jgi:cytochrome c553
MKIGSFPLALRAALIAILVPVSGHTAEKVRYYRHHHRSALAAHHRTGIEAKIQYCTGCHGRAGHGYRGYFAIAQLAGQQEQYLENQLSSIGSHVRDDPVAKRFMWPVLSHGSPDMYPELARHFSELHPAPAADGPRGLVAEGRKIYEEGVPESNIPACAACHGPDAHGQDQIPRLAGQLYPYLLDELGDWQKGYRSKDPADPSNENIMKPIASAMSKQQMKEVAAYLSYQK